MFMPELKLVTVRFKNGSIEVVPEESAETAAAREKVRGLRAACKVAFYEEVAKFQKDQKHKDNVWSDEFDVEEIEDADDKPVPVACYNARTWSHEFWLYQPLTKDLDPDGDYSFHVRERKHKYAGGTTNSDTLRSIAGLYGETEAD